MTTDTITAPRFFARFMDSYDAYKRKQQTRRELNALSDRDLDDIGISRYDIASIVADVK